MCLLRGTNWIFKCNPFNFLLQSFDLQRSRDCDIVFSYALYVWGFCARLNGNIKDLWVLTPFCLVSCYQHLRIPTCCFVLHFASHLYPEDSGRYPSERNCLPGYTVSRPIMIFPCSWRRTCFCLPPTQVRVLLFESSFHKFLHSVIICNYLATLMLVLL